MRDLTEAEQAALDAAAETMRAVDALPILHPTDAGDVVFHVHAIQNIILARPAMETTMSDEAREAAAVAELARGARRSAQAALANLEQAERRAAERDG